MCFVGLATTAAGGPFGRLQGLERVERVLGLMGTVLSLEVESPTRADALEASERAVRELESAQARLSTWRDDSELSRLNRAPVGAPFELSVELARELAAARLWWAETGGAFDPALGGLVRVWDLRGRGRVPSIAERRAALVEGGFGALELHGRRAVRTRSNLVLEEGGFGKGAGLDAALAALTSCAAVRARLDLGGQIAVFGAQARPYACAIADPGERGRTVLRCSLASGSLSTSGNSERGLTVDGQRIGHLLDPRTGLPAGDFGSLTVLAADATSADCLSTGLFVLGPEAALAFGQARADIDVLVLEPQSDGALRARATGALGAALEPLEARVRLECLCDQPDDPAPALRNGALPNATPEEP